MIDPNAPAFPSSMMDEKGRMGFANGLTKREYFAAMAMQSLLAVDLKQMAKFTEDSHRRDNCGDSATPSLPTYDQLWWGDGEPDHGEFPYDIGRASVAMADSLIAALNADPNP